MLYGSELYYYKTKADVEPLGCISLGLSSSVQVSDKQNTLELKDQTKRVYLIQAPTEEECLSWLEAIKAQINPLLKKPVQPPPNPSLPPNQSPHLNFPSSDPFLLPSPKINENSNAENETHQPTKQRKESEKREIKFEEGKQEEVEKENVDGRNGKEEQTKAKAGRDSFSGKEKENKSKQVSEEKQMEGATQTNPTQTTVSLLGLFCHCQVCLVKIESILTFFVSFPSFLPFFCHSPTLIG